MSDEAAPAASHSSVRPATVPAAPISATSTAQMSAPGDGHRDAPEAIDEATRRAPGEHARHAEAGQHRPARARAQAEVVGGTQRDEEAEAGDARVAGEGGGRQHADAAREHRAQRAGSASAQALGVRRREEGQHDGHRGGRHEGQPPVDLAQQPADRGRERDGGRSARRRTSPPPGRGSRAGRPRPGPASSSGVRKALAVPDAARATMNRPIVGATAAASEVAP